MGRSPAAFLLACLPVLLPIHRGELGAQDAVARRQGSAAAPASKDPGKGTEVETARGVEVFPAAASLELRSAEPGAALGIAGGKAPGGRKIPLEDLLFIRPPAQVDGGVAPDAPLVLFLRDGSELCGRVTSGDEDAVRFRVPGLGEEALSIPLEALKGLLVAPAETALRQENRAPGKAEGTAPGKAEGFAESGAGPARRSPGRGALRIRLREEISSARGEKDEVILLQEGRVQGILESLDAQGVRFGSDSLGDLAIGYEKLRALILAEVDLEDAKKERESAAKKAAAGGASSSLVRLTLHDGSSFPASLREIAGGKAALDHEVLGSLSAALSGVAEIAFLGGKTRYLSDMEPALVREHLGPAFQKKMPHRRDANVLGDPLRMGGREYRKGLGVHSYSLLQYDLGGAHSRFQATIGLDDSARPFESQAPAADVAHVVFRVRVDDRQVFEKALSWKDAPLPVDIPVSGARSIALEVDFGVADGSGPGFNFARDRANWAEARVIR